MNSDVVYDSDGEPLAVGQRVLSDQPDGSTLLGHVKAIEDADGDAGTYADDPPRCIPASVTVRWDGGKCEEFKADDERQRHDCEPRWMVGELLGARDHA